jgi:ribonuclease III
MENEIFGYRFVNGGLLEEALTTPSFRQTTPNARDNQRLEFLGDSVLQMLATDFVFAALPTASEGTMTNKRQHMVSSAALCEVADRHNLAPRLRRNTGATELPRNSKIFADAVEAIIGAAYLDGGFAAAEAIFDFLKLADNLSQDELEGNPRTVLQQRSQAMKPSRLPIYTLLKTEGTSNEPVFTVKVQVEGLGEAVGSARSRKEAETSAAETLLNMI